MVVISCLFLSTKFLNILGELIRIFQEYFVIEKNDFTVSYVSYFNM